ncbi:conserved hypothetical protein [Hahella chejuensis KCTC 2396]|uniref:Uncharacterized protein n=1 Tax=Hahella chejuensis (strain KCTC 2396) TaxID=349521 RepID=Q2SMA4_HAHCH|nr:conserved hypothetical protein [Hahella chejuensis KCTC 2396]
MAPVSGLDTPQIKDEKKAGKPAFFRKETLRLVLRFFRWSGLLRLLTLHCFRVDSVEVDRLQHQCREAAFNRQHVDSFASVREQDVRAESAQGLRQLLRAQTVDHEYAGLLHFDNKRSLISQFGGDGQGQNDFPLVVADFLVFGVQVHVDLWLPLGLENRRRVWRFERKVFQINTLQRENWLLGSFCILRHDSTLISLYWFAARSSEPPLVNSRRRASANAITWEPTRVVIFQLFRKGRLIRPTLPIAEAHPACQRAPDRRVRRSPPHVPHRPRSAAPCGDRFSASFPASGRH